jgi:hypothetical protein
MLSCAVRGLEMGRSPVQGARSPTETSRKEQARGPNPWNIRQRDSLKKSNVPVLKLSTTPRTHVLSLLPVDAGGRAAGARSWPLISISTEVKNAWGYTSTPSYVFIAWCLMMMMMMIIMYKYYKIARMALDRPNSGIVVSNPARGMDVRTESITKYTLTTINTRWEATQRVMAAELTRLTHNIAIHVRLVAESCTICSSLLQAASPETFG